MTDAAPPSFHELKLSTPILKALEEVGYETPSPIQAQTIPHLLDGLDLLGHAPTGTGKTAAFALPLISRLDLKKLEHMSGQHIAMMEDDVLVREIQAYLAATDAEELSAAQQDGLGDAMYCLKDRARSLPQLLEKAHFVLTSRPIELDEKSAAALDDVSRGILTELTPQLQNASWTRDTLEAIVSEVAERHDLKLGKLAPVLRAAIAGRAVSPSVFDMMLVIGRDETVARLADVAAT